MYSSYMVLYQYVLVRARQKKDVLWQSRQQISCRRKEASILIATEKYFYKPFCLTEEK